MSALRKLIDPLLLTAILGLTLATAYIHFWVGGVLLVINSAGYVGLAGAVVGSTMLFRRALPLVLIALALYAAATIAGWLVMGPYFDVAYIAKGVEIALIVTISITLRRPAMETRTAVAWALSLASRLTQMRPSRLPGGAAAASSGDE